jgi:hypothetical protein
VFALTAVRNVKFHFGQKEIARSTAKSAGLREDRQEQKAAAEKTAREDSRRHQKMLISKF